jgi:hypothetical protein
MVPPIVICRALTGEGAKRFPYRGIGPELPGNVKLMRPAIAFAALALVLTLAGCGGTSGESESSVISSSVANRLAAQSESIAAAWEAGDHCGAAKQADDLKHAADEAIAAGEIPAAYQDDLKAAVVNLQNTANCDTHEGNENEDDHGQGNDKGKGHDKHDDGVTTTTETLTDTTTGEGN